MTLYVLQLWIHNKKVPVMHKFRKHQKVQKVQKASENSESMEGKNLQVNSASKVTYEKVLLQYEECKFPFT